MKNPTPKSPCPYCKSYNVVSGRLLVFVLGASSAGCLGILLLIIVWPIGLIAILGGFVLMLSSFFTKNNQFYCQNCRQRFEIPKS